MVQLLGVPRLSAVGMRVVLSGTAMTELFLLMPYSELSHSMPTNQRNISLLKMNLVCLLSYCQFLISVLKTDFLSQNHLQMSSSTYFLGLKQSKLLSKFG